MLKIRPGCFSGQTLQCVNSISVRQFKHTQNHRWLQVTGAFMGLRGWKCSKLRFGDYPWNKHFIKKIPAHTEDTADSLIVEQNISYEWESG